MGAQRHIGPKRKRHRLMERREKKKRKGDMQEGTPVELRPDGISQKEGRPGRGKES